MSIEGFDDTIYPIVYASKHKDDNIRLQSRSGGVFTALTDEILQSGGSVYGCALNGELEAVHKQAVTMEERDAFRGSKYVQSTLADSFQEVEQELKNKKLLLFSGTPCQIAGLKMYLKDKDLSGLYLIDIVCHGVSSPKVYRDYLHWIEKRKKARVSHMNFRNKIKYGWEDQIETLTIDGKEYDSKIFSNLYGRNNILRPSCYQCPFKKLARPGDITIADFWGVDRTFHGFHDNKGVSLVFANNEKGYELVKRSLEHTVYQECKAESGMQPSLSLPVIEAMSRDVFWSDYAKKPFSYIVRKYAKDPWRAELKMRIRGKYL